MCVHFKIYFTATTDLLLGRWKEYTAPLLPPTRPYIAITPWSRQVCRCNSPVGFCLSPFQPEKKVVATLFDVK